MWLTATQSPATDIFAAGIALLALFATHHPVPVEEYASYAPQSLPQRVGDFHESLRGCHSMADHRNVNEPGTGTL